MIRARDNELILWDGFVYERRSTPEELGISSGRSAAEGEPSGVVATERISHGDRVFEPGEELPSAYGFPQGAHRHNISISLLRGLDLDRLIERGLAKRKLLSRRRPRS